MSLPVEQILSELGDKLLQFGRAILCAAPGAGKTTAVPQYLLKRLFPDNNKKIIMLEPRRIAARAAAGRIAALLGERPGETVGYRTRLDTCISAKTRIEIVTEGILTRILQNDPALEDYGLVIFDEFHERSIHADLALALTLDSIEALRPDLKILIMSATLDAQRISALTENAPVIESPGRMFPIETVYAPGRGLRVEEEAASVITGAVHSHAPGDILVFLPGEGEIRRTAELLKQSFSGETEVICPLYGNLTAKEQDSALDPDPDGRRKIILSTSIAETSLTIDGVATVIDCGLMRVPKFSPRNGMNRLETIPVSLASADQRRGRAGRTQPGVCIRLWAQPDEARMAPFNPPAILESDLTPFLLELTNWGVTVENTDSLKWLDPPPKAKLDQAAELLKELGALDDSGRITAHGKQLLEMPVHPRLGHAVLASGKAGFGQTACLLAALLTERESGGKETCDIGVPLQRIARDDSPFARMVRESASRIAKSVGIPAGKVDEAAAGIVLALSYPDRIGRWRAPKSGEYALSNGTGAKLRYNDHLGNSEFIAAANVEGEGARQIIFSAAAVSAADLRRYLAPLFHTGFEAEWNHERKAVSIRKTTRLGKLLIAAENAISGAPAELTVKVFFKGIRSEGIAALEFGPAEQSFRERVGFIRKHLPESDLPDLSDEALLDSLETWLGPFTDSFTKLSQLKKLDMKSVLSAMMTHQQLQEIDRLAPERITVPTGSKIRVDYSSPDGVPSLSVRLQELFGMLETPRVVNGKVPVVIHMLSPAMRPVQITADLKSFWNESYFLVRKDMRGRYPKHYWPENPLEAEPTKRVHH